MKNERILSVLEEEIARLEEEIRAARYFPLEPRRLPRRRKGPPGDAAREHARRTLEAKMWEWEETSRKVQMGAEVTA